MNNISIFRHLFGSTLISQKRLYGYGLTIFLFTTFLLQSSAYANKISFGLTLNSTVYAAPTVSHYFDKQVPELSFGTFFQYQLSNKIYMRAGLLMDFERLIDKTPYVSEDEIKYLMTHLQVPFSLMYSYYDLFYIHAGLYLKKYLFSIKLDKDKGSDEQIDDFLDDPETGGLIGLEFELNKFGVGLMYLIPFDRNSTERGKNVDQLKIQLNYHL